MAPPPGCLLSADPVRETTRAAIAALRHEGLNILMLTGDNQTTADAVARAIGGHRPHPGAAPARQRIPRLFRGRRPPAALHRERARSWLSDRGDQDLARSVERQRTLVRRREDARHRAPRSSAARRSRLRKCAARCSTWPSAATATIVPIAQSSTRSNDDPDRRRPCAISRSRTTSGYARSARRHPSGGGPSSRSNGC